MPSRQPSSVPAVLAYAVLGLWTLSAFVRMVIALSDSVGWLFWVALAVLLIAFAGWAVARRFRTGRLPTDGEQRAAFRKFAGVFWRLVGGALTGACVGGFILLVELNGLFSREAIGRAAGQHPVAFWAAVGAGVVAGLVIQAWEVRSAGPSPATGGQAAPPPAGSAPSPKAAWQALADEGPARKIDAIKAYRDETGADLADAKRAVEEYVEGRRA